MLTKEDIIIRLQPYSKELIAFCKADQDFKNALKINNPSRFVSLGAIVTSHSPFVPEDEIIGFYTYDYKIGIFKQDFIVNVGGENKDFILYTRLAGKQSSKNVKDISQFFTKYSKGKYYIETHHPKYEDLPEIIKPRALEAVALANKIKSGLRNLTPDELSQIDLELQRIGL